MGFNMTFYKNLNTNKIITSDDYLRIIERESEESGISVLDLLESEQDFVEVKYCELHQQFCRVNSAGDCDSIDYSDVIQNMKNLLAEVEEEDHKIREKYNFRDH